MSEEQKQLLLEYAKWYDSHLASPEDLVEEFIQYKISSEETTTSD